MLGKTTREQWEQKGRAVRKKWIDFIRNMTIKFETRADHREVENLTRESFGNVYRPGIEPVPDLFPQVKA